jgi:rRNA biogenesis protein RRP5
LKDIFVAGRVVKVRILSVDLDPPRVVASIRQASSAAAATVTDISDIITGAVVEGVVTEIHKTTVVLSLRPSQARALLSLKALANIRGSLLPQLKASLKVGEVIESLVVVSRNEEKGFVTVAGQPKATDVPKKGHVSFDNLSIGQVVGGRVTRHGRHGAHIKVTGRISGTLHPTDTCDDYEAGIPFPAVDSILKTLVVDIDNSSRHLTLSSRPSRLAPDNAKLVVDREINTFNDLNVGDSVRGFIKSVAEHGLFVMIGRNIDARVQIRELFDGVGISFGLFIRCSKDVCSTSKTGKRILN